jgi:hypothetical protein
MQPCALFRTFCEYFRLDDTQASVWRTALSKAAWSEARSWARDVQAFAHESPHGRDKFAAVEPFFRTVSPPARVVAVVESLVQEQLLTRQQAIIISSSCSVVCNLV